MSRDYLVHHGILGQKWGVRRYQNPDGSLTEAGKKRYRSGSKEDLDAITNDLAGFSGYPSEAIQRVGKERTNAAANLGLKALAEQGRVNWKEDGEPFDAYDREWFIIEDQTIGLGTVADLINQGYSAKDVKTFIKDINNGFRNIDDEEYEKYYDKYFDILEGYGLEDFADVCERVKNKK